MPPSAPMVSVWHWPHRSLWGCGAAGGRPWQVPHFAWSWATFVHVGVVFVPPVSSVAP